MKKILGIIVLSLLLSGCASPYTKQDSLGEFGQFFEAQTRVLSGRATVEIISLTPKSISFWYKSLYVDLNETTNAAQYHCQKNNLDAVLKKEEDLEYGGEMKAYFECK